MMGSSITTVRLSIFTREGKAKLCLEVRKNADTVFFPLCSFSDTTPAVFSMNNKFVPDFNNLL
jgi:hypothetical protein